MGSIRCIENMRALKALITLCFAISGNSASPEPIPALQFTRMENVLPSSIQNEATGVLSTASLSPGPSTVQQIQTLGLETPDASGNAPSSDFPDLPAPKQTQSLQLTDASKPTHSIDTASGSSSGPIASESPSANSENVSSPIESLIASFNSGSGIGSIDKDLSQLAKGVEGVLNPDFLNEVTSVFKYLSTALEPPVDTDIRAVVGNAKNVLTEDNSKKLINLVTLPITS